MRGSAGVVAVALGIAVSGVLTCCSTDATDCSYPELNLSEPQVHVGDRLTVSQEASSCFVANGNANAALPIGLETTTLSQRAATLATAHSDAKGAFSATIIVPALKPGIYELTVYGVSCDDGGGSSCAGVIGRQVTVLG